MADPLAAEQPFRDWVGRTETAHDLIHPELVRRHNATIPGASDSGERALPGIHWCLAPPAFAAHQLGPDGHPQKGIGQPPIPLPRRMWAGGTLLFIDTLRTSDEVERVSKIEAVTQKIGRMGEFWIIAMRHSISTKRGLAIEERQDIVYTGFAQRPAKSSEERAGSRRVIARYFADPVLLFRFSALTFNGHRIHYDFNHATRAEGYPDLVVHGPLQATLLMQAATRHVGGFTSMAYRASNPLLCNRPFHIGMGAGPNRHRLEVVDDRGVATMSAEFTR